MSAPLFFDQKEFSTYKRARSIVEKYLEQRGDSLTRAFVMSDEDYGQLSEAFKNAKLKPETAVTRLQELLDKKWFTLTYDKVNQHAKGEWGFIKSDGERIPDPLGASPVEICEGENDTPLFKIKLYRTIPISHPISETEGEAAQQISSRLKDMIDAENATPEQIEPIRSALNLDDFTYIPPFLMQDIYWVLWVCQPILRHLAREQEAKLHTHIVLDRFQRSELVYQPSSPALKTISEMFQQTDFSVYQKRKRALTHKNFTANITTAGERKIARAEYDEVRVEFRDVEKIINGSKGASAAKFFKIIMINAGSQAFYNKQMTHEEISFPFSDLIELGIYKSAKVAKQNFQALSDKMTSIKARGTNGEGTAVLFPSVTIGKTDGAIHVELGKKINWGPIMAYRTIFPTWGFSLSKHAFSLCDLIFYLARQNIKGKIGNQGMRFNISMKNIQNHLGLPDEKDPSTTGRHKQLIKDPIIKAIEEIEGRTNDFKITPSVEDIDDIATFLNGYVTIELTGEYSEIFEKFNEKTIKKIKKAAAKKERIEVMARAKNLEKKISETDTNK